MKLLKNILKKNKPGWTLFETIICVLIHSILMTVFSVCMKSVITCYSRNCHQLLCMKEKISFILTGQNYFAKNEIDDFINFVKYNSSILEDYKILYSNNGTPLFFEVIFNDGEKFCFSKSIFIPGEILL